MGVKVVEGSAWKGEHGNQNVMQYWLQLYAFKACFGCLRCFCAELEPALSTGAIAHLLPHERS